MCASIGLCRNNGFEYKASLSIHWCEFFKLEISNHHVFGGKRLGAISNKGCGNNVERGSSPFGGTEIIVRIKASESNVERAFSRIRCSNQIQTVPNRSMFVQRKDEHLCILLLYVDDLVLVSNDMQMMVGIKTSLAAEFEMTDVGEANYFLGIHIKRDADEEVIELSQSQYMNNVLKKFGMENCKAASTPMEQNSHLEKANLDDITNEPYRQLIGCLMYSTQTTRPDLCASVGYFSRFQGNASDVH